MARDCLKVLLGCGMHILIDAQRWLYGGSADGLKVVASSTDPVKLMAAIAFAVLFGSVHALMPGHGKSVLVSYYLGRPSQIAGGVASSALLVLTHVGMAIVLVLTGFMVVQRTLAGAGRTPALETFSSALIIRIGAFLLVTSLRGHSHARPPSNPFLAIAAGFVPCPLTTFIMVYAVSNGMIFAGLLVTAAIDHLPACQVHDFDGVIINGSHEQALLVHPHVIEAPFDPGQRNRLYQFERLIFLGDPLRPDP
jgi:nickel/cobalt transporter (NicO) family protein